jgi:hypothetical protein
MASLNSKSNRRICCATCPMGVSFLPEGVHQLILQGLDQTSNAAYHILRTPNYTRLATTGGRPSLARRGELRRRL